MDSYFSRVVIPSTSIPIKSSYNVAEVLELLGISRATFYRRLAEGALTMTRDKRVYYKELENYFEHCDNDPSLMITKTPALDK